MCIIVAHRICQLVWRFEPWGAQVDEAEVEEPEGDVVEKVSINEAPAKRYVFAAHPTEEELGW